MPKSMTSPDARPVPDVTAPARDRAVDVARLAALVVVMFGHCALLLATIDAGGVRIGNLLGALPAIEPVTWVVQVMPLFFLAGGAAGAYGWRSGTPWGTWLFTRAQRLCRPVFWYLAAWTVGLLVVRLTLGAESAAGRRPRVRGTAVVSRRLPRGAGLRPGADPAAAPGVRSPSWSAPCSSPRPWWTGPLRRRAPRGGGRQLRDRLADPRRDRRGLRPPPDRRRARRWWSPQPPSPPRWRSSWSGRYEVSLVVTGAERMSNVSPPTLLLALHCTWMSCVFVAAAGAIRRWAERPRVWHVVAVGNGGAMTLYLWHIPAIAVATFTLHAFGLDAYDVHAPGFWGLLALRAVVFAVVMAVMFRLLSPLEHRRLPWWDAPAGATGARSIVAGRADLRGGCRTGAAGEERADRSRGMVGAGLLRRRGGGRAGRSVASVRVVA